MLEIGLAVIAIVWGVLFWFSFGGLAVGVIARKLWRIAREPSDRP